MSLPYEYFKNKNHIADLLKIKDDDLYFIVLSFYDEEKNFNKMEGFNFKNTLINPCDKIKKPLKDLRNILNDYIDVINKNDLYFCSKMDIERLLTQIDKIELKIKKLMAVRILKEKVNLLVRECTLNIRILCSLLGDFTLVESHLWDEYN